MQVSSPSEWKRWYGLAVWRKTREAQLKAEPFCRECDAEGRVTIANTCDHIDPHKGDWVKFIQGPFQSLCSACHSAKKQAQERLDERNARLGCAESSKPPARQG